MGWAVQSIGLTLSLSFPVVFHTPFFLPLGGDVEDDGGVGGGFVGRAAWFAGLATLSHPCKCMTDHCVY